MRHGAQAVAQRAALLPPLKSLTSVRYSESERAGAGCLRAAHFPGGFVAKRLSGFGDALVVPAGNVKPHG